MPVNYGLKLWVDQKNAEGGVMVKPYNKKIPIKLIAYDDQSSTATAATLYNQLITRDKVDLLVSDSVRPEPLQWQRPGPKTNG
jgi:branched-chain amino acid transport system substrate-binding protein